MDGTMKAVVARNYGRPAVLTVEDMSIPRPGPGQIQVRMAAAALNPMDVNLLSGAMGELAPLQFPHVPGNDFAGTVTEVGEGVSRFAVGDEVFGNGLPRAAVALASVVSTPPSLSTGTMAEYAVFEADAPTLALRPVELEAERAAALPTVGLTALSLLRAGRFQPGETVLVIGATGGVGSATVPLLTAAKVHVIATARPADEEYVRTLGAEEVIDHHTTDIVAETSRRHPGGIDAVVNLARPGNQLADVAAVIRPGGRLLNIAQPATDPSAFEGRDLTVETVYGGGRPGDLGELTALAADGTLPPAISRRYPLNDGPRAYRDLQHGHTRGKLIVVMEASPAS